MTEIKRFTMLQVNMIVQRNNEPVFKAELDAELKKHKDT